MGPFPVKEYDLFVPLFYNDGSRVEARKLRQLKERLLDQFDGVTYFPQPNEGLWKMAGVAYRDRIVLFRVLSSHARSARRFLSRLKEELREDLRQVEILIVERNVETF
jgi:hypothetical protein